MTPRAVLVSAALVLAAVPLSACGGSAKTAGKRAHPPAIAPVGGRQASGPAPAAGVRASYRVPRLVDPHNVYAADRRGALAPIARHFRNLIYVPNSASNTVDEIDPADYRIVRQFTVGGLPQHVVPSYDLRTLWVTNDNGNSLTPINPISGRPGRAVAVADPYNMYFSPDGRYAMVMAERLRRIDFRDAQTMKLHHSLKVPGCAGVNHADFTANGRYMFVSCEFAARMIVVDVAHERKIRTVAMRAGSSPQDVKLSPDGRVFYVADLTYGGVWKFDARTFKSRGFVKTGAGAHGLYPSRDARSLYVSNRGAGTVSVIRFSTGRVRATWTIPGGSPDMGGVSASGRVLWLAGRYDAAVYAINTRTGKLIRRVPVGLGPHGLCVYPQPGRYSLGHTGIMR
jgi:DNA-binding beta-propeller fold protein YncE